MESTRFSLNWKDAGKGALVAFGTAFVTAITEWLNAGSFPTGAQLKMSAVAGLSAAFAYLLKNFFTDDIKTAQNIIQTAQTKAAVKEATNFEKPSAPKDTSL